MFETQLSHLQTVKDEMALIYAEDLTIKEGTLTYGYNCDKDTIHVYVKDGVIHSVQYSKVNGESVIKRHIHGNVLAAETLKPEKRSYPEATLYSFAAQMIKAGVPLSLTTFDPRGRSKVEDTVWEPGALIV